MPRMALIWLMTKSLIIPMMRSSKRPLSTISPASASSAGTGLAKAREQRRKQTRRVLIIFSGEADWGETGRAFLYVSSLLTAATLTCLTPLRDDCEADSVLTPQFRNLHK